MSEQFDMEIYNIALRNGSYTEPNKMRYLVNTKFLQV